MKKFNIAFNLYFVPTRQYEYDSDSDDSNSNDDSTSITSTESDYEVDIDSFMLESYHSPIARYLEFVDGLSYLFNGHFSSISYKAGVVRCTLTLDDNYLTKDEVISILKYNSLEDGEYEGGPGSTLVYPFGYLTRDSKYFTKEIGLIDYRDNFTVEEI